jgi:hypothetical protein
LRQAVTINKRITQTHNCFFKLKLVNQQNNGTTRAINNGGMLKQEKYFIKCLQQIGEKLTEAKDYAVEKLGMRGDEKYNEHDPSCIYKTGDVIYFKYFITLFVEIFTLFLLR